MQVERFFIDKESSNALQTPMAPDLRSPFFPILSPRLPCAQRYKLVEFAYDLDGIAMSFTYPNLFDPLKFES